MFSTTIQWIQKQHQELKKYLVIEQKKNEGEIQNQYQVNKNEGEINPRAAMLIQRQLNHMCKNPEDNFSAGPIGNDLFNWEGMILGPKHSPYEGGFFYFKIQFPKNYYFSPPKITFTTKIYHPNIDSDGNICLDILQDQWSPALMIGTVLLSIVSIIDDPLLDDPFLPEIANLYKNDRRRFNANARAWTKKYAQ